MCQWSTSYLGVGLRHVSSDALRMLGRVAQIDADHYPESMAATMIINAPAVFSYIYSLVRPLLPQRTQQKIKVIGTNYMDQLTRFVPFENIPEALGGSSQGSITDNVGPWDEAEIEDIHTRTPKGLAAIYGLHKQESSDMSDTDLTPVPHDSVTSDAGSRATILADHPGSNANHMRGINEEAGHSEIVYTFETRSDDTGRTEPGSMSRGGRTDLRESAFDQHNSGA